MLSVTFKKCETLCPIFADNTVCRQPPTVLSVVKTNCVVDYLMLPQSLINPVCGLSVHVVISGLGPQAWQCPREHADAPLAAQCLPASPHLDVVWPLFSCLAKILIPTISWQTHSQGALGRL